MSELDEVIRQVQRKAERFRAKGISEQDTKRALIEPVFRALGWDLEDLSEVKSEYKRKSQDKPVDYAFLDVRLRSPLLFVEAKALGKNLDDRKWANQIMGYAAVAGVEWVVLTDGDEYRIYNAHAPVPVDDKIFRKVQISEDPGAARATLELLSKERMAENQIAVLWKAHFIDRQVHDALKGLFDPEIDRSIERLIRKRLPKLPLRDVRESLQRATVQVEFSTAAASAEIAASSAAASPQEKAWETRRARSKPASATSRPSGAKVGVKLADMIAAGALRPPVEIEAEYKGQRLVARIEKDGGVHFDGERYRSLSTAGGMALLSAGRTPPKGGARDYTLPPVDGWSFWRTRDETGELVALKVLRSRYLAGAGR